jgi:ubiquinone/menaquinone biosynthesis C-methylase UbiE
VQIGNPVSIESEPLAGKAVLEIGSGRGDTTRELVALLSGQAGAKLIVTDISDTFFSIGSPPRRRRASNDSTHCLLRKG